MPHTVIRMLMESFCWDMQFFIERFYDDQENLFKEANIANPFAKGSALTLNDAVICQVSSLVIYTYLEYINKEC